MNMLSLIAPWPKVRQPTIATNVRQQCCVYIPNCQARLNLSQALAAASITRNRYRVVLLYTVPHASCHPCRKGAPGGAAAYRRASALRSHSDEEQEHNRRLLPINATSTSCPNWIRIVCPGV